MSRIAITGLGIICPIANNISEFINALQAGTDGIEYITKYDAENEKIKTAGEVKFSDFNEYISKTTLRRSGRATRLGIVASSQAIKDSLLDIEKESENIALIVASGAGEVDKQLNYYDKLKSLDENARPYFMMFSNDSIASFIAIELGIKGINYAVSCGCSSASIALIEAIQLLKLKKYKYVLVCGTEAPINRYVVKSFEAILSKTKIKPFDLEADGFVLSEGAGAFLLEDEETAKVRGANIYASITGSGYYCDAYSIHSEPPTIEGKKNAIYNAFNNSGITYSDIDYINPYGSGLKHVDQEEIQLFNEVFKERARDILISSTKSMIGHSLGASAAIESISTILSLKYKFVPPTINLNSTHSDCNLNFVPNKAMIGKTINRALKLSYATGNKNTAIVFERYAE